MSLLRVVSQCLVAVVVTAAWGHAQVGNRATLFEGARLIAGDGSAPVEDSAFLVEGDSITWVGRRGERQAPAGATRVDLTGKTVMPSLIDGHNHIGLVNVRDGSSAKANYTRENLIDQLERYAYYGVSAALSMGLEADMELALQIRNQVLPNAARFLTVGKGIAASSMGGPTGEARLGIPWGARTEAESRQHVRELKAKGVTFVKIWVDDREGAVPKLAPNVYRAIIDEAHTNGMEVLAHLSRTSALADAKDLFRAGIDGFVHTVRDADVDAEYLALVKAHPRTWIGPNIPSPGLTVDEINLLAETLPVSQIAELRKAAEARIASGSKPNVLFELHCRNLRKVHDAGMVIGMGTDGTGDGFGAHEQIASYTKCGMNPAEALVAATGTNAKLLGLNRLGLMAPGKEASFNVLDANPLDDITNTRRIDRVYLRGVEVDRKALRARWTGNAANMVAVQTPAPRFSQRTFKTPDGSTMRYGLSVPSDYAASRPRPLVVALHPGGSGPYYGDGFMRSIFEPGLRNLSPIMVAPDVPGRSWAEPGAEQAVMSLVAAMTSEFAIDPRRIMVAGFSMGGAGTWYLSSRHADRFTAAIVMAGRSEEPLTNLGKIPTYVIHSRADEVVPFAQAEQRFHALQKMGRPVVFDALSNVSHYNMGSYLDSLTRGGRWVSERWER